MINAPTRAEEVYELLRTAVPDVFKTMLQTDVELVETTETELTGEEMVAGSVGFLGDLSGVIHIHLTGKFARVLSARMLGMEEHELEGDDMVNDAIGEISNMVVGAVKSRLCDDGSQCVLTIPSIVRGQCFSLDAAGCPDRRVVSFRGENQLVVLELQMKSAF